MDYGRNHSSTDHGWILYREGGHTVFAIMEGAWSSSSGQPRYFDLWSSTGDYFFCALWLLSRYRLFCRTGSVRGSVKGTKRKCTSHNFLVIVWR
jgi:hypothetical protein